MPALKGLLLSIAVSAAAAWSADSGRYPIRQIDRPLILPKRMWQERLGMNQVYFLEEDFQEQEEMQYGFLPSLPRWSITDNLSWEAVPAPLFKYQLTPTQVDGQGRTVIKDYSLAVEAGVTTMVYSSRDGFEVHSVLGLDFKKPWGNRFWGTARLGFGGLNWEPYYLSGALGLGIQITERTYAATTYIPLVALQGGPEIMHTVVQDIGINFHSGLSLGFHAAFMGGLGISYFSPGSTISFQW